MLPSFQIVILAILIYGPHIAWPCTQTMGPDLQLFCSMVHPPHAPPPPQGWSPRGLRTFFFWISRTQEVLNNTILGTEMTEIRLTLLVGLPQGAPG